MIGEDDDYFDMLNDADDGDDEIELAELSCGELPEGGCSLAGTEHCDWRCPFSAGMVKRMNEKPE
jgi:hypothetical protein